MINLFGEGLVLLFKGFPISNVLFWVLQILEQSKSSI